MINLKLKSMASFIVLASLVCGNVAWAPPPEVDCGAPKSAPSQQVPGTATDGDRSAAAHKQQLPDFESQLKEAGASLPFLSTDAQEKDEEDAAPAAEVLSPLFLPTIDTHG